MTTEHRRFKDGVYEQLARIGKAVAAPKRIELLDLLSQGPRTVEALAEQSSLSIANTSQHLKVLRGARLVDAEKKGLYVEYRLADHAVGRFLLELRKVAQLQLSEIERMTSRYFQHRGALEVMPSDELLRRVRRGEVTVLDVRPTEEFRAGHIPGAISMPVRELKKRVKELPKNRELVAYCRGPYCVIAVEAVELLRKKGFVAHRKELGISDWRARGFRVQVERQGARA